MKLYLPNTSTMSIGGGWTFRRNFTRGLLGLGHQVVNTWQECDAILITGATMTSRDEMREAKKAGKKIFFRIDNMPKDSNNRGTAFSRMRDFALMADGFIYQSEWAKDYVGWWIYNFVKAPNVANNIVIYNGIDNNCFYFKDNPKERRGNKYLYVRYNRDENKRFPEAAMYFHKEVFRKDPNAELVIVGKFSQENIDYNFDFFAGEKISYHLPIEDPMQMGEMMRQCKYFLFPAYADASPNTLHEAIACGLQPLLLNEEGGSKEVVELCSMRKEPYSIEEMSKDYINFIINS
jgi:hypothetical protein